MCNTSTLIIAFHVLAHCTPRPSVSTLNHGRALYCIRTPGMTHTYVANEPSSGLGLIVRPLSRLSCCKLLQHFFRIASTLKPFLSSLLSNVTNRVQNQDNCMDVAADCTPLAEAVNLSAFACFCSFYAIPTSLQFCRRILLCLFI